MIQIKDLDKLKEAIIKKGFTYRTFALEVNCSQTHVSLILKGFRNPSSKLAKKICKVLEMEFDDIFFIFYGYKSKQKEE